MTLSVARKVQPHPAHTAPPNLPVKTCQCSAGRRDYWEESFVPCKSQFPVTLDRVAPLITDPPVTRIIPLKKKEEEKEEEKTCNLCYMTYVT